MAHKSLFFSVDGVQIEDRSILFTDDLNSPGVVRYDALSETFSVGLGSGVSVSLANFMNRYKNVFIFVNRNNLKRSIVVGGVTNARNVKVV